MLDASERTSDGDSTVLFRHRYRYFVLILGWLCLASISSNMIALNFTLICMSPPSVGNGSDIDTTK